VNLRILLVEDNPDDAELLIRRLREAGIEPDWERVDTAHALREALAGERWDVALVDFNLPGFSGPEAIGLLAELAPDTPAITVSGAISEETAVATITAGAVDYVLKDNLTRLAPAVLRAVDGAELRRQQRPAEEELRESGGFLRGLFDNMPSGAAIYEVRGDGSRGSDYIIQDFNAASLRIEGKTRKEVVGKSLFDLRPAIDEYGLIPVLQRVWQTGEPAVFPTTLYSDEHYTNWYENHIFRLPTGEVVAIYNDVSERRQSEEALRQSEAILTTAESVARLGSWRWDLSTQRVDWSQGMFRLFDVDPGDFDGDVTPILDERVHPDDRAAIDEATAQAAAGQYTPVEYRVIWRDGTEHVLHGEGAIEYDADGTVVTITGYYQDITERKQAEEALRGSEARYRGYVDNAPYGVFVSDEQGRYLEVNQAAAGLTGYAPEELVQLSIPDVLAPESHEWGQQHFARLLETGHASGHGVFLHKDGTSFPARVDAVRLTATRYLGFIVDISEQQRAAAELEASAAQVKQSLTATVAALGATTELRDPYTAGHQRRVAELAGAIAAGLGWDAARIETVTTAGLLHDVGKIIVPAEILARPGRLSELEMQIIRGHAAASAALIAGIEFGGPVAAIVNQHHERLDGSGYPQGLTGENILPEARILAVADVVEAMSSHRPYRPALGMEAALAEVREHAGEKYDADVIAVCSRLIEEEGFQFTP
jgi:PAS domain S-box-containing protein/putative nucleotidyltransferase with HDIG domain